MKKCPFCAEEIQDEAVKCRFCGEFLTPKQPWYFKSAGLVVAILCVGPFALPLVWLNPHYGTLRKIWITVLVLALTYVGTVWFLHALSSLRKTYAELAAFGV